LGRPLNFFKGHNQATPAKAVVVINKQTNKHLTKISNYIFQFEEITKISKYCLQFETVTKKWGFFRVDFHTGTIFLPRVYPDNKWGQKVVTGPGCRRKKFEAFQQARHDCCFENKKAETCRLEFNTLT